MTLLEELNGLLKKGKYSVPAFRAEVSMSGNNKQWLSKNLKKNPDCDPRVLELLSLPMHQLVTPKKDAHV